MQIRFADSRPTGDFALVLPAAGKNRSALDSLGEAKANVEAVLGRQRFEGESASSAEAFVQTDGGARRVLVVGTGDGSASGGSCMRNRCGRNHSSCRWRPWCS